MYLKCPLTYSKRVAKCIAKSGWWAHIVFCRVNKYPYSKYDCFQYMLCLFVCLVCFFSELNFVVLSFISLSLETIGVEPCMHWLLWKPKTHKSSIYEVRMQVPFLCVPVRAMCLCWLCALWVSAMSYGFSVSACEENNGRHIWKEDWSNNAFYLKETNVWLTHSKSVETHRI